MNTKRLTILALVCNASALQLQGQNLEGESEILSSEIEDSELDDSMLLMTSSQLNLQLDLATYLDKKHHKKKHGGKSKKDGPMITESKGTIT